MNNIRFLIFIIIIFIIVYIYFIAIYILNKKSIIESFNTNNNIWLYWENKKGKQKSNYLNLCYKTIEKQCSNNFKIHILNENTVYNYLPNLRKDLNHKLNIPQKADYIRLQLLHKYGGIWLDADIIVLNDLSKIIEKLNKYDFIGFGCHFKDCTKNGYPKPANWVFAARKGSILIKKCIEESDEKLDNHDEIYFKKYYHILGRQLLWKNIEKLKKNSHWNYYHFDSKCIERDSKHKKLVNKRLISDENIDINCKNLLFIPVYNTAPGFPDWFLNMSEEEHLESDTLFAKLIRKGLEK